MATIDSKKLLPPSKKTGAIEKQKFLVPLKNISTKKISAGDLRPVDKETPTSENLSIVKRKIVELELLLKDSYTIDKKNAETRRKEEEKKKFEGREKKLESKVKKNQVSTNLIPSIPGQSIFDKINRFIGFTLLGYLFNKYGELLPKLLEFGKVLKPVAEFVEGFAKNLLKGAIDFVEFGYKAYDQTRDFVKQIGGEGAQKTFDEFSKNLNILLNGAIASAMLIASTSPGKPGRPGRPGRMPGGKPSVLPKNAKLASYLGRDAQTKLIERRYGNDAARMYEARKAQGASVSRARADVLKRFDKLEGPQRGLAGGTGKGSVLSRGLGKSANRAALKVLGKTGTKIAKGVFGRVPIIGGLLDFAFSIAMGEDPGRAAAKAVGATVGSALGTFIPIPFAGTILGGILGDIVGGAMYDTLVGNREKPQAKAQGGTVTGSGQSRVAKSRRIKTTTKKTAPRIQPQKTQPGKDAGGKLRIEKLYGTDEPGKRSALRALKKSSEDVKKMRSVNGLAGSMFGAGIDMALGQKPDKKLAKSIGDVFGSVVQNAVDMELNKSFGDISKTIAMAGGGAVPTREIGRSLGIGERIGKFISTALAISIESSASKILQNLNRELNLEGGGAGSGSGDGTPPGGVPAAEISEDQRKASDDLIKYFEKLYGKNAAVGIVANLLRESGLRTKTPDNARFEGMAQWSRDDRWPKFVAWAESKGKEPYSRSAQAEWIAIELKQLGTDARLKKAESAEAAASLFYNEFERAAYSKPVLGDKYNPDNPHERKNRAFVASLIGGTGAPAAMVEGGVKPTDIPTTSPQGWRWGKMHKGVDLDGGDGSPISSAQDAKVVWAGDKGDGYGNSVILKYSNGAETRFAHLKSVNVSTGGSIKAGQLIGRQGNTGSSTASHLHFEYYPNGGAMTYEGYGNAASVMNSYFRYGGNVVPKLTSKPADIFSIDKKQNKKEDKNKPSQIFDWKQSSIAPTQPSSSTVAFANSDARKIVPSYLKEINNNLLIQEVQTTVA